MLNIEKFKDVDGKPRLHIKGGNGEILLSSEAYESVQHRDDMMNLVIYCIRDNEYSITTKDQ